METFVDEIISDRFGLNYNFIEANHLTWIDNLETSSGGDLASTRHPDHSKPYVQDYLARFGGRKCEANALVVTPDRGCAQKPWRPQKRRSGASRKVR